MNFEERYIKRILPLLVLMLGAFDSGMYAAYNNLPMGIFWTVLVCYFFNSCQKKLTN